MGKNCNHDHHEHHEHEHHHHGHHHGHHHHGDTTNLGIAFLLNVVFTFIEIAGGLWTNSVAILSDALHDFGDSLTIALAWGLNKLSEKGRDKNFSYGYRRFSVLGAIFTSTILIIGSIFIIIAAIHRLQVPQEPYGPGMLVLAVLGVIVNGSVLLRLRGSSSINTKAIMLHHIEDVLGWVAVLFGSIGIWFFGWYFLDPVLSIGIALFILYNVFKNLKYSLKIFLQAIPVGINIETVTNALKEHPSIAGIHDMHIWSLDGEINILTTHIVLHNEKICLEELIPIKQELETILLKFGIKHSTIEFETLNEECNLSQC